MRNERTKWEKERKTIASLRTLDSELITLDISGERRMTVCKSLLTKFADSPLAVMFSGRHKLYRTSDGAVFIDRDAEVFSLVITYLRNGCRIPRIEDSFLRERFNLELDHWLIEPVTNPSNQVREN